MATITEKLGSRVGSRSGVDPPTALQVFDVILDANESSPKVAIAAHVPLFSRHPEDPLALYAANYIQSGQLTQKHFLMTVLYKPLENVLQPLVPGWNTRLFSSTNIRRLDETLPVGFIDIRYIRHRDPTIAVNERLLGTGKIIGSLVYEPEKQEGATHWADGPDGQIWLKQTGMRDPAPIDIPEGVVLMRLTKKTLFVPQNVGGQLTWFVQHSNRYKWLGARPHSVLFVDFDISEAFGDILGLPLQTSYYEITLLFAWASTPFAWMTLKHEYRIPETGARSTVRKKESNIVQDEQFMIGATANFDQLLRMFV